MTEEEFMGLGGTVDNESEDVQTVEEGNTEEVIDNVDDPEVEETDTDDGDNDTTQSNDEPEQPQGVQPTAVQQAYRERLEQEYQQAVNRINPYTGRVIQSPQDFLNINASSPKNSRDMNDSSSIMPTMIYMRQYRTAQLQGHSLINT